MVGQQHSTVYVQARGTQPKRAEGAPDAKQAILFFKRPVRDVGGDSRPISDGSVVDRIQNAKLASEQASHTVRAAQDRKRNGNAKKKGKNQGRKKSPPSPGPARCCQF